MVRRVFLILASMFAVSLGASPPVEAQQFPPVRLTLEDYGFNDGTLTLCLRVEPPFDTPTQTPQDGQFDFTFQKQGQVGQWEDAQPPPQTGPVEGVGNGSPASKWKLSISILEPFTGRLCIVAKKTGMPDSDPVYVQVINQQKSVRLESMTGGSLSSDGIELPSGFPATFRLVATDIATGDQVFEENGRYHLQIEGPGAASFAFVDVESIQQDPQARILQVVGAGRSALTVQLVDGEATFSLTGAGTEPAWLVGFDEDRGPDDPDALSPIRLRLRVR